MIWWSLGLLVYLAGRLTSLFVAEVAAVCWIFDAYDNEKWKRLRVNLRKSRNTLQPYVLFLLYFYLTLSQWKLQLQLSDASIGPTVKDTYLEELLTTVELMRHREQLAIQYVCRCLSVYHKLCKNLVCSTIRPYLPGWDF